MREGDEERGREKMRRGGRKKTGLKGKWVEEYR